MKSTDFAYAAGYIDGDGCFYIGKVFANDRPNKRYTKSLQVTSATPENLDWFKKNFGGTIRACSKYPETKQRQLFQYILRKNSDIPFISQIIPYLVEKTDEAMVFLEFFMSQTDEKKDILLQKMYNLKNHTNLVCKNHKIEFEAFRNTIEPTWEDYAYLAGFIDAECCLNICKYHSFNRSNALYKIQLQCNNTKFPVFKWLLQRFGGQIHFIDRRTKNISRRDQLCWRLTSAALGKILENMIPFLIHKKPVAKELLIFYKNTLMNGGARHTEEFRSSYARTLQLREDIFHRIQILNKKGT